MGDVIARGFIITFLLAYTVLLVALIQWTARTWFGARNKHGSRPSLNLSPPRRHQIFLRRRRKAQRPRQRYPSLK